MNILPMRRMKTIMNKKAMGKLSLFLLTILVVENLLLGGLILL
jgi:hypothetical protein